jgi:hypothetical protein
MPDKMREPATQTVASDAGPGAEAAPEPSADPETETEESSTDDQPEVETEELSLDIIFEMLRNRRRQLVLEYLRERDETVTIGDLAEHIAAIENDTTVRQLNAQQRKRVYIGLYQCHLPKMDDVGVIDFNQSRGRIAPGRHIEPLYEYLDVANGETTSKADARADAAASPFDRRFLALSVGLSAVFFVAQFAGAYLFASATVATLLLATVAKAY